MLYVLNIDEQNSESSRIHFHYNGEFITLGDKRNATIKELIFDIDTAVEKIKNKGDDNVHSYTVDEFEKMDIESDKVFEAGSTIESILSDGNTCKKNSGVKRISPSLKVKELIANLDESVDYIITNWDVTEPTYSGSDFDKMKEQVEMLDAHKIPDENLKLNLDVHAKDNHTLRIFRQKVKG